MSKAAKLTIRLNSELVAAIDRHRAARGQTRSEFFRVAAEKLLQDEQERRAVERYVRGYQECPETDEEVAGIHQSGVAALAQEARHHDTGSAGQRAPVTSGADR